MGLYSHICYIGAKCGGGPGVPGLFTIFRGCGNCGKRTGDGVGTNSWLRTGGYTTSRNQFEFQVQANTNVIKYYCNQGRVKKKWEFSHLGGAFIFDIFSHFQKLISKHALNHAKMQRIFFVPSDKSPPPSSLLPQIDIPRQGLKSGKCIPIFIGRVEKFSIKIFFA